MASRSKNQIAQSSSPPRKPRTKKQVNLHPSQNNGTTVVGIGAYAGGLEASGAELQAVNEELLTVNNELRKKVDEISRAHSDLENLMGATEIATLFLDRELRIRHYTPGMQELFNIMPSDHGRPIGHLTHKLDYTQFVQDAEEVLRTLVPIEREVRGEKGEWFLLRMRPLRTTEDRINGVIFTFVDITQLKTAENSLVELNANLEQRVLERTRELDEANSKIGQARDLFSALFHANPIPTALTLLEDDVFIDVNVEFLNYFNLEREDILGRSAAEFNLGLEPGSPARTHFITHIKEVGRLENQDAEIVLPSGEMRNILASAQYINLDNTDALISTFIDITERVHAERKIRELATSLTRVEQQERHRLSQILHDDLQQRIFAVKMQLSFLREWFDTVNVEGPQVDIDQLDQWLAEAIATTRQLSMDLSPPILQGEGLHEALIWLASQMKEQYNLDVDVPADELEVVFDDNVRILLFQALRELLFNIVKHSGTLKAEITIKQLDNDRVRITVSDDGKGFDAKGLGLNRRNAHGLLQMRDRLFLLGCTLELSSEPNNGTHVTIDAHTRHQMD